MKMVLPRTARVLRRVAIRPGRPGGRHLDSADIIRILTLKQLLCMCGSRHRRLVRDRRHGRRLHSLPHGDDARVPTRRRRISTSLGPLRENHVRWRPLQRRRTGAVASLAPTIRTTALGVRSRGSGVSNGRLHPLTARRRLVPLRILFRIRSRISRIYDCLSTGTPSDAYPPELRHALERTSGGRDVAGPAVRYTDVSRRNRSRRRPTRVDTAPRPGRP